MAVKRLGLGSLQAVGGLEPVVHNIITPDGEQVPLGVGDWSATEDAPGGFTSASGRIPREWLKAYGEVYRFGATWRSVLPSDGFCVYSGRLLDPAPDGTISSRGTGTLLEKNAGRRLYMNSALGDWSSVSGDPYNNLVKATTGQAPDGNIEFDAANGVMTFMIPDKSSAVAGDFARAALWARNNDLRLIHFTLHPQGGKANLYIFEVMTTKGPDGGGAPLAQRGGDISLADGVVTTHTIALGGRDDLVAIDLKAAPGIPNQDSVPRFRVRVRDLYVLGIADSVDFSISDLMTDVCGEFGISTSDIDPSDIVVVPLDMQQGSFAENVMPAMMMADWRYLILDHEGRPYCDLGPWDKRIWRVVDQEAKVDLQPLDRFNVVQVPYQFASGRAQDIFEARLTTDFGLGFDNVFSDLTLGDPLPGQDQAQALGDQVLRIVSSKRFGGNVVTSEVIDLDGNRVSAQRVRAGDTLILDNHDAVQVRVKQKTMDPTEVSFELDEKLAALDKMLALRSRRLARLGY